MAVGKRPFARSRPPAQTLPSLGIGDRTRKLFARLGDIDKPADCLWADRFLGPSAATPLFEPPASRD
jgi:hypothetical protein